MAIAKPQDEPRTSTVTSVVETLRQQILRCELMPGQQMRQDTMASALKVSRAPMREALRVLAGEGLLEHRPNQGYFVARLSADQFRQIVSLLEFLETELIRTMRWPTKDELVELHRVNRQIIETAGHADLATITDLNRQLHFMMFRLSPQDFLTAETERYWMLAQPYRLLHVASRDMARSALEHEELLDALAAHDRPLCLRISAAHRQSTMSVAMQALSPRRNVDGDLAGVLEVLPHRRPSE